MIKTIFVEGIAFLVDALDFVGFDYGGEEEADCYWFFIRVCSRVSEVGSGAPVCYGKECTYTVFFLVSTTEVKQEKQANLQE